MRYPGVARFQIVLPVAFAAAVVCGCAQFNAPRIDPSGDRFFLPPPVQPVAQPPLQPVAQPPLQPIGGYRAVPPGMLPSDNAQLLLSPSQVSAPIGSQVVIAASVRDQEGYLRTNERVEWTLAPGSVGGFTAVNGSTFVDYLFLDFNAPGVIDSAHAVGSTSRDQQRLTRGTSNPADDVIVERGQAWITVSSPIEGVSYVTAFAPSVYNCQLETAIIHWVDADFCFPPPAISPPGGRHVFTTTVVHHSNRAPCVGWRVRYRITGGPPAGFAPSGAQEIEVPVNQCGQASAEIFQDSPATGSNIISIEVLRPGSAGGSSERPLLVGTGSTTKTWGSPSAATYQPVPSFGQPVPGVGQTAPPAGRPALQVQLLGPTRANVGEKIKFEMIISNTGQARATGLKITDRFDEGLEHPDIPKRSIERDLTDLGPGESHRISVELRVVRPGQWRQEVEVTGMGGLRETAQAYVTAIGTPSAQAPALPAPSGSLPDVSIRKSGPTIAAVGRTVLVTTEVTNTGTRTLTNLTLVDRYDDSFKPIRATEGHQPFNNEPGAYAWKIDGLLPGSHITRMVECECIKAAIRASSTATVTDAAGLQSTREWYMQIQPGVGPSPSTIPPSAGSLPSTPAIPGQSKLTLKVDDVRDPVPAGKRVTYEIQVINEGQAPDQQVVVVVTVPPTMEAVTMGTSGPLGTRFLVEGQSIRFDPVTEIRPGETLNYRVLVLAKEPGDVTLRATLTSKNLTQPVTADESTHVFAQ